MEWGVFVTGRRGSARVRAGAWLSARRGAALRVVVERQHALFTIISYVKGGFQGFWRERRGNLNFEAVIREQG